MQLQNSDATDAPNISALGGIKSNIIKSNYASADAIQQTGGTKTI